jgi:hypothetical protein
MAIDWLASSLKDRASSRPRWMDNAYPLHTRRGERRFAIIPSTPI